MKTHSHPPRLARAWPSNPRFLILLLVLLDCRSALPGPPPIGPSGIPLTHGSYGLYELGDFRGGGSLAYDIAEDGSITGEARDAAGEWHAFVWKDGVLTKLTPLPGGTYSSGRAISDAGLTMVGGMSEKAVALPDGTVRKVQRALRWRFGVREEFDDPEGSQFNDVHGMTLGGTVVGSVATTVTNLDGSTTMVVRAARWFGGRGEFLTSSPKAAGEAFGVNRSGTLVVGAYRQAEEPYAHAVIFGNDPPQDIHTRPDQLNSVAVTANSGGIVGGYSYNTPLPTYSEPFLWTEARGMWRPSCPPEDPNGQVMKVVDRGVAIGVLRNSGATLWLNLDSPAETWVNVTGLIGGISPRINGPASVNGNGEIAANYVAGTTHAVFLYPTNLWRQVSGTIRTLATESVTNATGTYPTFTYPLRAVPVELLALNGSDLVPLARQVTDDQGRYAILIRAGTPGTQYALRFTLSDSTGWVDLFDASTDTNAPAWLRTPAFNLDHDVRGDVDLVINASPTPIDNNATEYRWNGAPFGLGASNAPPADAASNSTGPDFAHLTVIYRNLRLAAQFAKERLNLSMPRIPAYAFEVRGEWGPWQLTPTRTNDVFRWVRLYTNMASRTSYDPLSLHFAQLASSFNQPTLGIPNNTNGYFALGILTNTVTGVSGPTVPLVLGRERPDNREFHEYGHAIMFHSSIGGIDAQPPLVTNPLTGRLDTNHGGYTNSLSTDSWIEGFAEFISAVISSKMLDLSEKEAPQLYLVQGAALNLDDLMTYVSGTNVVRRRPSMEEFLVASLLWDVYDSGGSGADDDGLQLPIEDIWSFLSSHGPQLLTLKGVYDALHEFAVNNPFRLDPIAWDNRAIATDLYDDRTFTDGRADNFQHDSDEVIGRTSWNRNFPGRWNAEAGTFLSFEVRTADGSSLSNVVFEFDAQYEPPLADRHYGWLLPTYGPTPVGVPFVPPAHPCRITVTPHAPNVAGIAPFVTTSAELDQALDQMPPGADGELLAHTFIAPTAPRLQVARLPGASSLEISWPVTGLPYELQFTFSLAPPVAWGRSPGSPTVKGDRVVQILAAPSRPAFLRLIYRP